jgi:hypothetical protein
MQKTMTIITALFISALVGGCAEPKHVSPDEFKKQYAVVGILQTMRDITYLGQRDGKAFIRVRAMSSLGKEWSDHVIYVDASELDPAFRLLLPKLELQ